ncbi:MAG: medium chain dehydrogenase/reductase family protein, partial [Pirellulaceae bacterium]|nr:medium chain dehydrogenase/reductase family protein [Pirellulaceae bacterium]
MLGATLVDVGRPLELLERTRLVPEHGEVVIDVRAAALNRRDYWITQGLYPGTTTPVVLGSDGSGTVSANGSADLEGMLGRDVVINPGWGWGPDQRAQSSAFRILGMPDDGCLANQVVAPAVYVHPKPAHLDWREA